MPDQTKRTDAHLADRDILRGPPGLLFGLTLLVFAVARLCFGWDSPPPQPEPTPKVAAAPADDAAPEWTPASVVDR